MAVLDYHGMDFILTTCLLAVSYIQMTLCCCRRRVLAFDILSMSVYSLAVTGISSSILLKVK